jgi:hypothetical protein
MTRCDSHNHNRHTPVVIRNNAILAPLDDLLPTCDNRAGRKITSMTEGEVGYDTIPTLARHAVPAPRHIVHAAGRQQAARTPVSALPCGPGSRKSFLRKQLALYQERRVPLRLSVLKTPPQSPQANALCERFRGTLRRECLDFVIPCPSRASEHAAPPPRHAAGGSG